MFPSYIDRDLVLKTIATWGHMDGRSDGATEGCLSIYERRVKRSGEFTAARSSIYYKGTAHAMPRRPRRGVVVFWDVDASSSPICGHNRDGRADADG